MGLAQSSRCWVICTEIGGIQGKTEMTQAQITLQRIEQTLPKLPLPQLEMVLTFAVEPMANAA